MTVALEEVTTHHDVAVTHVQHHSLFNPTNQRGVTRYQAPLQKGAHLDSLLINKQTDVLIVALHGAINRRTKELPRFEWMRTIRNVEYSSLYFADPCLELDEKLELVWYTGWKELDLYPIIAEWIIQAARAIGATKILLFGASGGGLAALQISAYIPSSMALTHSCQTSISAYRVAGIRYGAQRSYLHAVMPHLTPTVPLEQLPEEVDWAEPMGHRLSAVERYKTEQPNYVYCLQNRLDYPHVEQHFEPFKLAVENSPNAQRVKFVLYDGPENHNPPIQKVFHEHLCKAINWLKSV